MKFVKFADTAIQTTFAVYPIDLIDHQEIVLCGTIDTTPQWRMLHRTYTLPALGLLAVESGLILFLTHREKKKAQT